MSPLSSLIHTSLCLHARVRPRLNGSEVETRKGLQAGTDGLETGDAVVMDWIGRSSTSTHGTHADLKCVGGGSFASRDVVLKI